ncbi:MAG TPA: hypothetical protein VFN64_11440 [Burkholderiaceae bacterium]|nr:hypothetical protein [Burkholderiaceae bacterium]
MTTKKRTARTFHRGGSATLFERVRAATAAPIYVVGDGPAEHVATGRGFRATYRTEAEARRAAFLGMARRTP